MDESSLANMTDQQLIKLLRFYHPLRIRKASAVELGRRKSQAAVRALGRMVGSFRVGLPSTAVEALESIGGPDAVAELIRSLRYSMPLRYVVAALTRIGDRRALEPVIRCFERTQHPSVATALGNWRDPLAVDSLVKALRNKDSHVRYYAARALGKIGDPRALSALEDAARNDTSPITNVRSIGGRSVSHAARKAIACIRSDS